MSITVDDYLASLDGPTAAEFARLRAIAVGVVPEAEQGTSYGMAALKHRGKPLVSFLKAKDHLSLFPFSPAVIDAVRDRLEGFELSKGTIRFSLDRPLPNDVMRDIVRLRRAEIEGSSAMG